MKAGRLGALSAITASLCCVGPVTLAALGLGGLAAGALFARLMGILIGLAVLLLALGWRSYARESRRCRAAACQMRGRMATRVILTVASVIVAGFAFVHWWPFLNKLACGAVCLR